MISRLINKNVFKTNFVYNKDCLDGLKLLPNESVNLIATDPPYLMNYNTRYRKTKGHKFNKTIPNDNNPDFLRSVINEMYRVLKKDSAIYIFCNSVRIDYFKQELEKAGFKIKNIIVWVKNNRTAGDLEASFGKQYEFIILANKGRAKFNGKRLSDVWHFDRVAGNTQLHQNQKPLDLMEQIVQKHSSAGDIVLDPFMGSGTTAVACIKKNRNYIGFEIDKEYYNICSERIKKLNDGGQVSFDVSEVS